MLKNFKEVIKLTKVISIRVREPLRKLIQYGSQKKGISPSEYVRRKLAESILREHGRALPEPEENIGIPYDLGEE
jgi:hypothetical protein